MYRRKWLLGTAVILSTLQPAHAATIYGSLGNFDCVNDTHSPAHGFEIELDGCDKSQVYSTFGAPYNRYGTPTITTVGGNTFIDWRSAYSAASQSWAATTTYAGAAGAASLAAGTGGHSLYINSGFPNFNGPNNPVPGDHFGVALSTTPTNTVYHWLLEDPAHAGTLVKAGTSVMVPAPVFQPVPANPAQVQVVVPAPPAENVALYGDAVWVKVFTTTTQNANPVELNQLVLGNPAVPPETETEISWSILQDGPGGAHLDEVDPADPVGANESVTRRYEFYQYTGGYAAEDHSALHDTYAPAYVGDFLGNQNVAANFAQVPEPASLALLGVAMLVVGRRRPPREQ